MVVLSRGSNSFLQDIHFLYGESEREEGGGERERDRERVSE